MLLRSLSLLALSTLALPALAQQTPRELNTVPAPVVAAPDTTRPAAATAPPVLAPPPAAPAAPDPRQQQLPPANTTRYAVGLKSGQVLRGYDVEVRQPVFGRTFLLVDGQQKLDLNEVRYYEDETGFYVRTTLPGRSKRETTLRRDRVGRISLYSITSQQYMNNPYGMGGGYGGYGYRGYNPYGMGGYRTVRTEYFSKDNGPIEDLTIRNLQLATQDNPGSQQLLADARRYQTLTTLSYVGAGGLLLAGLVSTLSNNNGNGLSVSPLAYAAIPLAIVPLIIGSKSQNNVKQALMLYNTGR